MRTNVTVEAMYYEKCLFLLGFSELWVACVYLDRLHAYPPLMRKYVAVIKGGAEIFKVCLLVSSFRVSYRDQGTVQTHHR